MRFRQRGARRCKRLVDEQDVGAAIAHGVLVFERAPADIERHDHRAGPGGGEIKFEIAVGVERQDRDAVAGVGAERAEPRSQPRHALADLPPVPAPVAEHRREAVGIDLQRAPQSMRNIHRVPPLDFLRFRGR